MPYTNAEHQSIAPPPDKCSVCHAPDYHHWPECERTNNPDEMDGDKAQREAGYYRTVDGYRYA